MHRPAIREPECLALGVLALITRFFMLFDPRLVVWDEVHFERYTAAYFTGKYYIDVHPPLGKLLFYATARLMGVSGKVLAANQPAPELRVLPALAGALLIPVVYLLVRALGGTRRVATLAALLILVDNALIAISRVIVMDSMLLLFGMFAVLAFVKSRARLDGTRWAWLATSAVAAGMAAGTKWTGLTALGLIGLVWLYDVVSQRRRDLAVLGEGMLLVLVPIIVYVIPFAIHFALLPNTGTSFSSMSPEFQATLVGNPRYRSDAHVSFLESLADLHRAMMLINLGWATDYNAGASPWYTWPISKHPMGFWMRNTSASSIRWIIMFGNPIVWWLVIAGGVTGIIAAATRNESLLRHRRVLLFLAVGYSANFLPFALIKRPMYLYHYFFALVYGAMLAAFVLGALAGWLEDEVGRPWAFRSRASAAFHVTLMALPALTFLYLAPLSYGTSLTWKQNRQRYFVLGRKMVVFDAPVPTGESNGSTSSSH